MNDQTEIVSASTPPGERQPMRVGWYPHLNNRIYHGGEGVSSSTLKKFLYQTPASILYERQNPTPPTDAMLLGSAVHALMQGKDAFFNEFAILPELNLRTKDGREKKLRFEAENINRDIIKYEQYGQALEMSQALKNHPTVARFLDGCIYEQSIYWRETVKETGAIKQHLLKARPDAIGPNYPLIFDFKTARDCSYNAMQKEIINRAYHLSAAQYLRAVNQCKPLLNALGFDRFVGFALFCVQPEPPFEVACYELSDEMLFEGENLFELALQKYSDAITNGWPSYPEYLRVIEPPRFQKNTDI